jgi:hypothetical protein
MEERRSATLSARTVGTKSLQSARGQRAGGNAFPALEDPAMKFFVQLTCISEAAERRQQVFEMKRENLTQLSQLVVKTNDFLERMAREGA